MKLRTLQEISQLKIEEFDGQVSYNIELCSIYDNSDPASIKRWPIKRLRESVLSIEREIKALDGMKLSDINVEGVELSLFPMDKITLGEYIDLDAYASSGRIGHLLSVLYRRKIKSDTFEKQRYESIENVDVPMKSELLLGLDAKGLTSVIREFMEMRVNITTTYKNLFQATEPDEDDSDVDLTAAEIKARAAEALHKAFAWESFLLFLAEGDVTKVESVVKLPLYFALNMAAYKKLQLEKKT